MLKRLFILLFFAITQLGYTQIDLFDIQYPFKGIGVNIEQDEKGYVWTGTVNDFLRYNSKQFKSANFNELLGGNYPIQKIGDSIFYFKNTELHLYNLKLKEDTLLDGLEVNTQFDYFYKTNDKSLWLFTHNSAKDNRNVYRITKNGTLQFAFDLYRFIRNQNYEPYSEIMYSNGLFYIHLMFGGLIIVNPNTGEEIPFDVKDKEDFKRKLPYSVFRTDNKNNLWRICYDKFEIYNATLKKFIPHPISGKLTTKNMSPKKPGLNLSVLVIFIDSNHQIWLGCEDSNLFLFDKKQDKLINFKTPIIKELGGKGGFIRYLFEDRQKNIWGLKRGGIFKIRLKENHFKSYLTNTDDAEHPIYKSHLEHHKAVQSYFGKDYLQTNSCKPIFDKDGNMYSQNQRYSYRILAKNDSLELIPWFHKKGKRNLFSTKKHKIYTTWGRYYLFDKNLNIKRVHKPIRVKSRIIDGLLEQKNGKIWVYGNLYAGDNYLANLNNTNLKFEFITNNPKITKAFKLNPISSLAEDENNNLWIASKNGLYKLDTNYELTKTPEYKYYKTDSVKLPNQLTKFRFLKNDTGWLNNHDQIGFLNTKSNTFLYYFSPKDLNCKQFKDILPDESNKAFWYATRKGLGYYEVETKKNRFFDHTHTLLKSFFVEELTKHPYKNEIIATTKNGIHKFNIDSLLNVYDKKEALHKNTKLILNNYSVYRNEQKKIIETNTLSGLDKNIVLQPNDRLLTLTFELINYSYPDRHQYKTKLVGLDDDWSYPTHNNLISYSNLPAGKYTLKVKGSIGGNIWSDEELNIPIIVKEIWYKAWWFYPLLILVVSLIIYSITRYYYKLRIQQRAEIEKLRTKISIDLHDDVGSILTGLAMQSEILEHKANDNDKQALSRISELSRSAMLRMRDSVWAMDSRKNNWKSLIDRMNEFIAETLDPAEIAYQLRYDTTNLDKELTNVKRQNLYLIYKEAITNIIKHSDANQVIIEIKETHEKLYLSIVDNGTVVKKFSKAGLGLSNMKHRASQINCNIKITQDSGFSVIVTSKE